MRWLFGVVVNGTVIVNVPGRAGVVHFAVFRDVLFLDRRRDANAVEVEGMGRCRPLSFAEIGPAWAA